MVVLRPGVLNQHLDPVVWRSEQRLSEDPVDVSKRNDHHRGGHHNEAKPQRKLIQLAVAIGHGSFAFGVFYRNVVFNQSNVCDRPQKAA